MPGPGSFASLLLSAASSGPAVETVPPPPPVHREPLIIECFLDDGREPPMCAEDFPGLPVVSFLVPCRDFVAAVVADAEGV